MMKKQKSKAHEKKELKEEAKIIKIAKNMQKDDILQLKKGKRKPK